MTLVASLRVCRLRARPRAAALRVAALAVLGVVPWGAVSHASDKVFTVANYPVEASAENAVAAKEKAVAEGQQSAFRSLIKRLVPVTAFARAAQVSSAKAADMVQGVRVRSERNSTTDYIASYDFAFEPKAVRDLLRREGIPFSDDQAPPVTLVPVWRPEPNTPPREEAAWTRVWRGLDLDNALTPVKLQTPHKDARPDAIEAMAAGDATGLRALAGEYRTEYVVVALAELDAAAGKLIVVLAGRDAVGAFTLRRSYRVDAADPGYARELAAVVALRTLEGRWKAVNTPGATASGGGGRADLLISVEFRGMSEWQGISRKLSATPGVEELEVAGLSARGARVTLRYAQGAERLAEELARQGLNLRNSGGNWLLSQQ